MNKSISCDEILLGVNSGYSHELINMLLPRMCKVISEAAHATIEEKTFFDLCCGNQSSQVIPEINNLSRMCDFLINTTSGSDAELIKQTCAKQKFTRYINTALLIIALISPIGLFANGLILFTLYRCKRLMNPMTIFVGNLAVADLLVILQSASFFIYYKTGSPSRTKSLLYSSTDVFLGSASMMHVTGISIERGIAVLYPLKYLSHLTKKTAAIMARMVWGTCAVLFILSLSRIWIYNVLFHRLVFYISVTGSFMIPCALVLISSVCIIISVVKSSRKLQTNRVHNRTDRRHEIKLAFKVIIIIIPFVFGWGFFVCLNIYEVVNKITFFGLIDLSMIVIPSLIACLNPVTYLLFTDSLRKNSWNIIKKQFVQCCYGNHLELKIPPRVSIHSRNSQETVVRMSSIDDNHVDTEATDSFMQPF